MAASCDSPVDPSRAEVQRIIAEYHRRAATLPPTRDSLADPATLFRYQQRCRDMLRVLDAHGLLPLTDRKILEVGCGSGQNLVDFESWGARRQNLAGIDLLEGSVRLARLRLCSDTREADIRVGNASELPWPDHTFDIVSQSTVFTSILSDALRKAVADEMIRVARPDGVIVWYDFRVNNPRNPNVRRVTRRELCNLFAGCDVQVIATTLAPPLARLLVPVSWIASMLAEKLGVLNTHYIGVIRLPGKNTR